MESWLKGAVADVLHKVLGAFVHGIDAENLRLDTLGGDVTLRNLRVKGEAVAAALGVPLLVARGTVGELRIRVPWRNLGGEPMLIAIDRLFLLLTPKSADSASLVAEAQAEREAKREQLSAWESVDEKKKEGMLR